jgi:hypothetical protein
MPLPQNHLTLNSPVFSQGLQEDKFSGTSELRHLFSYKFSNILWWPFFKINQFWFTRSHLFKSCNELPVFPDLWKTIQKGAFAYNSLLLGIKPFRRSHTDLADITTLALFFGDEFIDGLAATAGKHYIYQLVQNDADKFYMLVKMKNDKVRLHYRFDLKHLFSSDVFSQINPKYEISYHHFYRLLKNFLWLINDCLRKLPVAKAKKAAHKIADACNTCFESFLHDVNSCRVQNDIQPVNSVLHFHETKTAYMQNKLLELRCILVDKEYVMQRSDAQGWLDIMRVVQIYDDMRDVIVDESVQDNLLLSVAYHYFPEEWKWFCHNKHSIKETNLQSLWMFLNMPSSITYCQHLATEKIKTMNWEQAKIMHYVLFKNSICAYNQELKEPFLEGKIKNFLSVFYREIKNKMPHFSTEAIKGYVIDCCFHFNNTRKSLLKKINFSLSYQLRYNLFSVPANVKASVFDLVVSS